LVYHFADHLGTVRVTFDRTGRVLDTLKLGPFGEVIDEASCDQRIQFTGHHRDAATGLDYMMARYYTRIYARFLTVDPVRPTPEAPQAWNAYSYAVGNPIRFIDPDGQSAWKKLIIIIWQQSPSKAKVVVKTQPKKGADARKAVDKAKEKVPEGAHLAVNVKGSQADARTVATALSSNRKARGPEVSGQGEYTIHFNPEAGPHADVHVQTHKDFVATMGRNANEARGLAILGAVAPLSYALLQDAEATPGEVASAALWEILIAGGPLGAFAGRWTLAAWGLGCRGVEARGCRRGPPVSAWTAGVSVVVPLGGGVGSGREGNARGGRRPSEAVPSRRVTRPGVGPGCHEGCGSSCR
jgi:RHS repeat-associated protein